MVSSTVSTNQDARYLAAAITDLGVAGRAVMRGKDANNRFGYPRSFENGASVTLASGG